MGLEGAWGLKEGGLDVTVLETAPGLLPRQLDDTASEMLKELCIEAGVDIVTGAKIAEITENAVVLDDGTEYEAQLVIMSTGMRPYTKVAEDSGIAVDKWVTADSNMRTNIPDVYTAGDCCSVNGQPQAFWAQAVETGRIAGANAAGDDLSTNLSAARWYRGLRYFCIRTGLQRQGSWQEVQIRADQGRCKEDILKVLL